MTSRDFCYWLQGYIEVAQPVLLSTKEIELIKNHLAMVFKTEIDPSFGSDIQQALNQIHNGPSTELIRC